MQLEEALKNSYENLGFAVLSIEQLPGMSVFEVEFLGSEGAFKRKVVPFFAMITEPGQGQLPQCNLPL